MLIPEKLNKMTKKSHERWMREHDRFLTRVSKKYILRSEFNKEHLSPSKVLLQNILTRKGIRFEIQVPVVTPYRVHIVDFLIETPSICIMVDKVHHTNLQSRKKDIEMNLDLKTAGIKNLRVINEDVANGAITLLRVLRKLGVPMNSK